MIEVADSIAAKLLKSLGFPRKPEAKNLWIRALWLKVPAFVFCQSFCQISRQGWFRTTFHATFKFITVQEKVESIAGYTVWAVNDVWAIEWYVHSIGREYQHVSIRSMFWFSKIGYKGKIDVYLLWPFKKKLIFWLVTRVNTCDFTVFYKYKSTK